jgi:glycosyltransferase involved in cell wall biosynthesis
MICILHGYLLDGSGSNLWTGSILRTLCQAGETVHVMCQEPHPERYDYVATAIRYDENAEPRTVLERKVPYPGRCILHKPTLGGVLPVYVWDKYEEYDKVVPMVDLDDATIEDYLRRNVAVLEKVLSTHPIAAVHVNHAVLMSVVAERVCGPRSIPFAVMPHGSAIEYAVKKDPRFYRFAARALERAACIFVIGPEMRQRVVSVFAEMPGILEKTEELNLGVDTALFGPVEPAHRWQNIQRLEEVLRDVERGKHPDLTTTMRHRLGDTVDRAVLRKALSQASDYTAKHTDANCEVKLRSVKWEQEKVLLFVGRLIASKGIQCAVAALPFILKAEPHARLLVVGHGPMREPMEAMLWALDHGKRILFSHLVEWGRYLEGAREPEPLIHVQRYLEALEQQDLLDEYFRCAQEMHISERVIFTGYLTHRELRYLFPCCDVALFPSVVAEAGPLVFLEAMASGVFPLGVYHAGMATSIDTAAEALPRESAELMKLRLDEEHTVEDIVSATVAALKLGRTHAADLRRVAVERYDWRAVAKKLVTILETHAARPTVDGE